SIGRLFFVDRDGADESCTATVVAPSVVVTAGHCVHELNLIGEDPKWTSDLLFVPGFRDNTRPYGSFVARQSVVDKTWTVDDQHTDHDQAFLVLNGHVGLTEVAVAGLTRKEAIARLDVYWETGDK
ncbi:trypsin-like serine peptidase, partial [Kibdelosporangium lantanae]